MAYTYTGDVHVALNNSYQADESPFPTDSDRVFPQQDTDRKEVRLLKKLLFPRCWNGTALIDDPSAIRDCLTDLGDCYKIGIEAYGNTDTAGVEQTVSSVLDELPRIRRALKKDIEAAYKGDPAAKTYVEIIRSYPGFHALLVQRAARTLYEVDANEYARELTEYAHSRTGIDIHPGAELGNYIFIDHGTGVVIGETTRIGDRVRIYQDVTLGALHFEEAEGEEHMLKKGYKRHPDIGNHVVIGAGSKILGPITIGDHVSIGANSWVTEDIPDHTSVYVSDHPEQTRKHMD